MKCGWLWGSRGEERAEEGGGELGGEEAREVEGEPCHGFGHSIRVKERERENE